MGSRNIYSHNMDNARNEDRRASHKQAAGYDVFKNCTLLYPSGWADIVMRYEHSTLWPLNTMMHVSQVVRFMLMEETYALSGRWLDATGNRGIDDVACASYDNILNMLHWGLKRVEVKDVQQVMTRGRKQPGQQALFDARDLRFDNMTLSKVKQLVRVAMIDWEAERHRLSNMDDDECVRQSMLKFDLDALAARAQQTTVESAHPAEAVAEHLGALVFDGGVLNDPECDITSAQEHSDYSDDDDDDDADAEF
jgi:hypothetical protein